MMTAFQNSSSEMTVFSTSLLTLAIAACDQLEKAGLQAKVCDDPKGYIVVVPNDHARESEILLDGEPHFGEIYLYHN